LRQIGFSVRGTDPVPGYQTYDQQPPHAERAPRESRASTRRAALTICTIPDIAAGFLGLWIVLYLLEANEANAFVDFVHGMADWLSGWAQDSFTMDTESLRVTLNYGLPAVVHLLIGHGTAARLNRA
jgi:hypothetical protein